MIIAIDGNEANIKEKVGVSVYTLKLLEYFQKKSSSQLKFIVFLRNQPNVDLPKENEYFKYKVVKGNFLWSQVFLPLQLYKNKLTPEKIDVFFSPAHYSPRFCPFPTIVTIHDLSYFYYPNEFLKKDLYQLKSWTKYSVEKAKSVIAVSQTTKKDLIKFYNVSEHKIQVVYNGYEKKNRNWKLEIRKLIGNWKLEIGNYLLYVGTLQPRKNLIILIQAFKKFKNHYPGFKLVLAGKKGWLYDEIYQEAEKLDLIKDVEFTGYVDDSELINLYKNAFCFVLPSLYEGFGITILEAMSFNCPVISSFSSSLPEIGGNACLYFDPEDPDELVDKLIELKENAKLRQNLIKKGKERIKLFSWQKCAEETLQVLLHQANFNLID